MRRATEGEEPTIHELLDAVHGTERRSDDFEVKDVTPVPSFVVKTRDGDDRKTFVNVCGCSEIPAPGDWSSGQIPPDVTAALKSKATSDQVKEALRFPLSLGGAREDVDKKGETCVVYDCLFSLEIVQAARQHRRLKVFLVGLALEWVSHKNGVTLSSDYVLPKLRYKGDEIQPHRVKVRKAPLVQELPQDSGEKKQALAAALPALQYTLSFENRPADVVVLQIELPPHLRSVKPSLWVCGFALHVEFPDRVLPLEVELPFAIDVDRVDLSLESEALTVCCPIKPITALLKELRSQNSEPSLHSGRGLDLESIA